LADSVIATVDPTSYEPAPVVEPPVSELMVRVTCWTKDGLIVALALRTIEVSAFVGETMPLEPDQPLMR
jgi:hypothetical protein